MEPAGRPRAPPPAWIRSDSSLTSYSVSRTSQPASRLNRRRTASRGADSPMTQRRRRRNQRDDGEARGSHDAPDVGGGHGIRLGARAVPGRIEIWRPGGGDPILVQNAEPGRRPFIHPIVLPGGEAILTAEPAPDDPSPPALSVALPNVNGI